MYYLIAIFISIILTVLMNLLFFLPFVATLILGFGNAEYLGNFETPNVAEESAQIEG